MDQVPYTDPLVKALAGQEAIDKIANQVPVVREQPQHLPATRIMELLPVSRLRMLESGERNRSNLSKHAKEYRPHLFAAMSSAGAQDLPIGDEPTKWMAFVGYYVTPWIRTEKDTGEIIGSTVLRLITEDAVCFQSHSAPILNSIADAIDNGLLSDDEPWTDIEMRFVKKKAEYDYHTVEIRMKAKASKK